MPVLSLGRDIVLWKHEDDNYRVSFFAGKTWEHIRTKKPTVDWSKIIWFSQGIPWYAFITWLAVQNRLSIGDKMWVWGINQGCGLCGEPDETRDHLFFSCPYSFTVWEGLVRGFYGQRTNPDWTITLNTIKRSRLPRLDIVLIRMLFQMTIYHVWRERNLRRHQGNWTSAAQMQKVIDKTMRNRIVSLRYGAQHRNAGLLQRWFQASG